MAWAPNGPAHARPGLVQHPAMNGEFALTTKAPPAATSGARVSVVIPCYNGARWIARAIESVLGQQHGNVEIIVIDDGSTDATPDILRKFRNIQSRRTMNQGGCCARNAGLRLATGDFVLFLDADDYLEPDSLEAWVADAEGVDIVFGPFAHERGRQRRMGRGSGPGANAISVACQWLKGRYTPPCAVLWRVSFVRALGGWAENLLRNQDGEIAVRGLLNGARVGFAARGCGIYVHHDHAGRVSKRSGGKVSASELSALDNLWRLAQSRGQGLMREDFAGAFYRLAYHSFATGVDDIGELALSRARELGLTGHIGSLRHRMLSRALGLRNKLVMTAMVKGRGVTYDATVS